MTYHVTVVSHAPLSVPTQKERKARLIYNQKRKKKRKEQENKNVSV